MKFNSKEEFKEHVMQNKGHFSRKLYSCTICDKKFTKSKLLVHSRVHTKEQPYRCKQCNMGFSIKSNLKRHIMIHTGERAHVCDICGKGFIQGLSLRLHRQIHFKSKDNLRHGKNQGDSNIPAQTFECKYCGRIFKRNIMYQAHLRKHSDRTDISTVKFDIPRPFKCSTCNQSYTTKQNLIQHQRIHGEKKYLCTVCGKRFHRSGSLQVHFRIHTGEKPHKCKLCDKSFAYNSGLETHMLQHTGEKPHVCKLCGKGFKQIPHLRHHERIHTGEKPYECPYCAKCFALKSNLTVHIRIHTGETPYYCDVCGKGFHDSSSMKKHKKGHRGLWTLERLDVTV